MILRWTNHDESEKKSWCLPFFIINVHNCTFSKMKNTMIKDSTRLKTINYLVWTKQNNYSKIFKLLKIAQVPEMSTCISQTLLSTHRRPLCMLFFRDCFTTAAWLQGTDWLYDTCVVNTILRGPNPPTKEHQWLDISQLYLFIAVTKMNEVYIQPAYITFQDGGQT
jgi:hypothetical protein